MADRRMFSKTIIGSARFLRMPPSSRLLYYDLGMYADDDGVVEAFTVMRQTNATEDDLRVLVTKGFVKILNEDLVTLIMDWSENNYIRTDRKKRSIYADLLLSVDTCPSDVRQVSTTCPSNVSIGKDRLGEDRLGEDSIYTPSAERYGEFQNVILTDEEHQKLVDRFPMDYQDRIEALSQYMKQKGKRYKSHYATILAWARKDKRDGASKESRSMTDELQEWVKGDGDDETGIW